LDTELAPADAITPPLQTDAGPHSADRPLDPNAILTAEFNYIAQTAFQANEDRARVTNFYLITLAGFVAAILGMRFEGLMVPYIYWAFVALFAILALASLLTLLQLIRLRQAWFDSVTAMNHLKDYFIRHAAGSQLGEAFLWKPGALPARYKPWSVGYLLALQVALLGGAALGAALVFVGLTVGQWWWGPAFVVALVFCGFQLYLYRRLCCG
jgi:hypothetical protein